MLVPLPFEFVFFYSHPILALLHHILLPHMLGKVCLLRCGACLGFWACITLRETGIAQTRAFVCIARWVPIPAISFPFHGPTGHVGPLGLLPLSLGFPGLFTSYLPLILPMGLLAIIPIMLAHWACYLFSWASSTPLLYLYLLSFPWACWLSFLPCWPIELATSFLGLPDPITSSLLLILPMGLLAVIPAMLAH